MYQPHVRAIWEAWPCIRETVAATAGSVFMDEIWGLIGILVRGFERRSMNIITVLA